MKRSLQSAGTVWLGLGVVACTYGLVRYAFGLSVPAAQRDLDLATSAVGLVSGATSVAYCVAAALAFLACERWPRAVVAGAGAVAALGAAGAGLAPTGAGFAVAVVVGSAGAGAASPGLVVLVRRAVSASGQDRAQAVVNSGTGPGLAVAGVLALLAGARWQSVWLVAGVVTAVVTGALLLVAPAPTAAGRAERVRPDVSAAWLRPAAAAVLLGVGSAAVWTYGRAVLEARGLGEDASILAWVGLGVGAAGAALAAPRLLRRGVATAWRTCVVVTGVATVALALPPAGPLPWLAAAVFGLGFTTATSVLIGWAGEVSRTPGPAVAALFVALLLGQALGAPVAGALLAGAPPVHGPGAALGVAGALTALAAGLARRAVAPVAGAPDPGGVVGDRGRARTAQARPSAARWPWSRSTAANRSAMVRCPVALGCSPSGSGSRSCSAGP